MIITFNKTGTKTGAFLGDSYRSEYVFSNLNKLPIATFICADYRATIKVHDMIFKIEPVPGSWTSKYLILDEDAAIGQIKVGPWFSRMRIELITGKVFNLKRRYKSIWDRLGWTSRYYIQLQGEDELVSYEFDKGVNFERWNSDSRYRELNGKIDLDIENLTVSLFGMFLIEHLLGQEGSQS